MSAFFAERALLPQGWARNVRFEVCSDGLIEKVLADAGGEGAERLQGPVLAGMPRPAGPVALRDASETDTAELLRDAGVPADEIERLRSAGIAT